MADDDSQRQRYQSWSTAQLRRIDEACEKFETALRAGRRPQIADFLGMVPVEERSALERELRAIEGQHTREAADPSRAARETAIDTPGPGPVAPQPQRQGPVAEDLPSRIGRYRVDRVLGEGGFGRVYLAYDETLNRPVAVKVPHHNRIAHEDEAAQYIAEAQAVAGLDHPAIVPVYDVGRSEEGLCYVVSKFIEGPNLAAWIAEHRPTWSESVALAAAIAEALHHAHLHGVVHRDIKPANILLDSAGKPYLVDFGLALKEEDVGKRARMGGTPLYMSPEQARGEGHRVDGRSDVFSLGVVFYELLTGRRPFRAESPSLLLEQITAMEPRPPRQVDDRIPKELERICLRALAKRVSDRYTTAKDLADDLRECLARCVPPESAPRAAGEQAPTPSPAAPTISAVAPGSESDRLLRIVPKGLRSFDAQDAHFFLELLPGPRDRDGLPESIRFWKGRIEETDPDKTFAVGLLYGPSGCGKSSLVKAGLLPCLADGIAALYAEATAGDTESRLLRGLGKLCPQLSRDGTLKASIAALRRGDAPIPGRKVVIVLDQFEQWLHAKREEENPELIEALRQCDGERVQCLVMVRDDFWMAASRFMQQLEVQLVEGRNVGAVDVFDPRHARKVLAAFGHAFGALPQNAADLTREQRDFLDQAVLGLSQEGKVVCIRLALFAEMIKGKAWTPATLKAVGGPEGIGAAFLEETFSARTAHPKHRLHEHAARRVLRTLLPEQGTDIKGHMRAYQELLEASGYGPRPREFEELIQILDRELRLVTPTDPEGLAGPERPDAAPQTRFYQLTHDYLVPSLREWLTRKQKETRRGRAELRLADLAALWNARPENRHLPSLWEAIPIRLLTRPRDRTEPQRRMLRAEARYHLVRFLLIVVLLVVAAWRGLQWYGQMKAEALVRTLRSAVPAEVPEIVDELGEYRPWAVGALWSALREAGDDPREELRMRLALLRFDPGQVAVLAERLRHWDAGEFPVIRDALAEHKDDLVEGLWRVAANRAEPAAQRFSAACALAAYDPPPWGDGAGPAGWTNELSRFLSRQLVGAIARNPSEYVPLVDALRPAGHALQAELAAVCRGPESSESERLLAASILAEYAAEAPAVLVDVLGDSDPRQFGVLFRKLERHAHAAVERLREALEGESDLRPPDPERAARRRANLAVALARLGRPESMWRLLRDSPDPAARSHLVHSAGLLGVPWETVADRLSSEISVAERRALVLSLGEYGEVQLPPAERRRLAARLAPWHQDDPDPGVHGAVEWLLGRWGHRDLLDLGDRGSARGRADPGRRWHVDEHGQTMVVLGPAEFLMGSPDDETLRDKEEVLHKVRLEYRFAIASKEVTLRQFRRFREDFRHDELYRSPDPDCPVFVVTWYEAAAYCNWLSRQAGLPADQWCYLPNDDGQYENGMRVAADCLKRTGYRLPTEAEWEYACRAGTTTSWCCGRSESLLAKYAWHLANAKDRTWPVGSLKPNDFGLFDMHGNVYEWCQDQWQVHAPSAKPDPRQEQPVTETEHRVVRGGSFHVYPSMVRSAFRNWFPPSYRYLHIGFRVARTWPESRRADASRGPVEFKKSP